MSFPNILHKYRTQSASYQVKLNETSGIVNDPNDWAEEVGNPRYILDLILSVIHVSTQTVDIVDSLPEIDFES